MELDENCGQSPAGSTKTTSPERAARRPYVLVVDDDRAHRHLMELVADFLQIHVTCVLCAKDGLDLLQQTDAFELILLDCRMPEVDGFAFARSYRALETSASRKRVPIVAVTGLCNEETAGRCSDAGMDDCLFKPFELRDLKAKIQLFFPSAQAGDEIAVSQEERATTNSE
ncbi:MAG TPA: response regulator [Trichormus sp.]